MDGLPIWADASIVAGAILVVALGAHWVVESAASLAMRLGVSELVIGLTVVAFGTSAPEFAVTLIAAFRDQSDISVANIVGSNIFNLGFILGGCALIRAIPTSRRLLHRDGAVIAVSTVVLLVLVGWDLTLDHIDGVLLMGGLVAYLVVLFRQRSHGVADELAAEEGVLDEELHVSASIWRDVALLMVGMAAIVAGSHFLVQSATELARAFGVSDWVIGVTIVAAGTSAPELATSLAGVIKGRYAISAGNVIGSDIFNLLGVLGLAGIMRTLHVDEAARISLGALCAMVFLVVLFMRTGWRVSRFEGVVLVIVAMVRWGFDFSSHGPPG